MRLGYWEVTLGSSLLKVCNLIGLWGTMELIIGKRFIFLWFVYFNKRALIATLLVRCSVNSLTSSWDRLFFYFSRLIQSKSGWCWPQFMCGVGRVKVFSSLLLTDIQRCSFLGSSRFVVILWLDFFGILLVNLLTHDDNMTNYNALRSIRS